MHPMAIHTFLFTVHRPLVYVVVAAPPIGEVFDYGTHLARGSATGALYSINFSERHSGPSIDRIIDSSLVPA